MTKRRLLFGSVAVIALLLVSAFAGGGSVETSFAEAGDQPIKGDEVRATAGWTITGTYLTIGVNDFGTFIWGGVGFQYPIGSSYESLAVATLLEGYLIAYQVAGVDYTAYSYAHLPLSRIVKVSASKIKDDAMHAVVKVVQKTVDNKLQITTTFEFEKAQKYVRVKVSIKNISGAAIGHVLYKRVVDWDVHGDVGDDEWSSDAHAAYAREGAYVMTVAGSQSWGYDCCWVSYVDLDAWDDYTTRGPGASSRQSPAGEIIDFDGCAGIYFDLGTSVPAGRTINIVLDYQAATI